ncbi:Glycosyl transferase 2 family protein [Hyella patelloides LEGE 07179]|uniref:Glycosyl transferase 2 family protein n=1 Tax=Hyella patelloides LEGE 07179 TaxID=945734 RepID=A0A563VWD8_9CYAN|nr:glycosyltransferase family 2 protein [Hyella patelloides]VEP15769.1 Glycosyl transferase 2 family protein [Hyella patelloides LEGE 07179]
MKSSLHSKINDILVIIPVRNEETTIVDVICNLQSYGLNQIRVVDNGSCDRSKEKAQACGVEVVTEKIPGYGQACWRGLQAIPDNINWILFCDGDGSDDLSCLTDWLRLRNRYDFILGDRGATIQGKAVMTPVQRFGNALATSLIALGWGHYYHDLGPLRLIRRDALAKIAMSDRGMGWTVEMQVRAVELDLAIAELPVGYFPRQGGKSKISGTISGSIQAGTIILTTLGKLYFKKLFSSQPSLSTLHLLSGILLLIGAIILIPHGDFRNWEVFPNFWLGMAVMSFGFILSWGITRINWWWFWLIAIATRILLLFMYPGDDIWRYLWEGYIQILGFSPYDFAPNATELITYRTSWWSQINHQGVSAIYPPLTQLGFRILATISPSVILFKSAFIVADLAICWLLTRQFSYSKVLIYAWNPLIIYSFAGGGHYDSWFILPLVAAWTFLDLKEVKGNYYQQNIICLFLSAIFIGLSIAIKWISLPILAFLAFLAYRKINFKTAILVLLLGILPFILSSLTFCSFNSCYLIPTSSSFVSHGRSADFIPYFLAKIWQYSTTTNTIFALPLALGTLFLLWKKQTYQQFTQGYFFILLIISPIIHGWYFTWIIPFGVATQNWGIRLISISSLVYFMMPYRSSLGNHYWKLTMVETLCLWLPFAIGYCSDRYFKKLFIQLGVATANRQ